VSSSMAIAALPASAMPAAAAAGRGRIARRLGARPSCLLVFCTLISWL